ncbi:ATP-binding protein [Streptomyces sp. NPDC058423]|uniref:ATP-binding protein n=1 Tax=unclassified Streptomyces TaxID=2593676 RepID=UPI003650C4D3
MVGYFPFEPEAANLFFQFLSGRYERASVIVVSNKPFARLGEVFGDDTVAATMIERLVHHAEVVSLATAIACAAATADGFPPPAPGNDQHRLTQWGVIFHQPKSAHIFRRRRQRPAPRRP